MPFTVGGSGVNGRQGPLGGDGFQGGSTWGDLDPYLPDLIAHMRSQEISWGRQYLKRSPQLHYRRFLVDWLCVVVENTRLTESSLHLAIKLLDFFMDAHKVEDSKIYLVAVACLTIAAKFEEKESKVPRIKALVQCAPVELQTGYTPKEHQMMELMVLTYFEWKIFTPTLHSYVEALLPIAIAAAIDSPPEQQAMQPPQMMQLFDGGNKDQLELICVEILPDTDEQVFKYDSGAKNKLQKQQEFTKMVQKFVQLSLKHCCFVEIMPSVLASSVIYAARKECGLKPFWPAELAQITRLDSMEFASPAAMLAAAYRGGGQVVPKVEVIGITATAAAAESFPTPETETRRGRRKQTLRRRKVTEEDDEVADLKAANEEKPKAKRSRKPKNANAAAANKPAAAAAGKAAAAKANTETKAKRGRKPKQSASVLVPTKAAAAATAASTPLTPAEDEGYFAFGSSSFGGSSASSSFMIQPPPTLTLQKQVTVGGGEGCVHVGSGGGNGQSQMTSIDMLLRASDKIEEAEKKHESFKEEILRDMVGDNIVGADAKAAAAAASHAGCVYIDASANGTNIEGLNVCHGNLFLYTVVKDEQP